MKVAFAGLGVMGYPMAGFLAGAGHDVTVCNRTRSKADAWQEQYAGSVAATPQEAAAGAEIVFCCVGNDNDVRQVILGDNGVLAGISTGSVIVDHTTASATVACEVYGQAKNKGVDFLDAPLSGGQAGAESGQLTIMVGGDQLAYERILPVMDCYAKACTLIGDVGCGQKAKMVNQICIAGLVQGLAEGLHFAKRSNLDVSAVIGAISKGAAQSWQMENRWQTMIADEFEFGFAVEWMRKDLNIALDEAERVGATLEVTRLVDRFYAEVEKLGGKRFDTSSLIKRLEP
ncbi:MAG: NAD(P)-dependent oxidoreductase [Proteobacteria bacterium]|nr:NAD(P)-dependent oxidoreductase [Pseudomonadota bacterium]